MPVTKEVAAGLAAKYPHLAEHAASAEPLDVVETHQMVQGVKKLVDRHRKFKLGPQIVSLREPAPIPAAASAPTPAKTDDSEGTTTGHEAASRPKK